MGICSNKKRNARVDANWINANGAEPKRYVDRQDPGSKYGTFKTGRDDEQANLSAGTVGREDSWRRKLLHAACWCCSLARYSERSRVIHWENRPRKSCHPSLLLFQHYYEPVLSTTTPIRVVVDRVGVDVHCGAPRKNQRLYAGGHSHWFHQSSRCAPLWRRRRPHPTFVSRS